jgi:hypothetical protein
MKILAFIIIGITMRILGILIPYFAAMLPSILGTATPAMWGFSSQFLTVIGAVQSYYSI